MATNSNPKIQKLMDEVEDIDPNDNDLEEKLLVIAQKVALEQRKAQATKAAPPLNEDNLVDPSDSFICEGCE